MKNIEFRLQRLLIIQQQIEDNGGEITPELEAQFTISSENVEERAEEMVDIRANCEMLIAQSKKRIARENEFIESQKRLMGLLDKGLKSGISLLGKLQAGPYKLSLRASASLVITDAEQIPDEYRKPIVVPETPLKGEPDNAKIKAAIEAGAIIAGAYVDKRQNLQIK